MLHTGKSPSFFLYLTFAVLMASCSALEETAYAPDDVYYQQESTYERAYIQDEPADTRTASGDMMDTDVDDYYDPVESRASTMGRDYYDVVYRDPYYNRFGRFGFNNVGWGMTMGTMRPGNSFFGYFGTGSYFGGGSSFYGYDPFMANNMYWNNPWASPYFNNGWGAGNFGGYSPYWMYPSNMYGGFYNPYMGFYDPYFGYYGYGGYCPNGFYPIANGSAYAYGPRSNLNTVNQNSNSAFVRSGTRSSNVQLMNDVRRNMERERTIDNARVVTRPQEASRTRTEPIRIENTNNQRNDRLSAPRDRSRTRSNVRIDNSRDRNNNTRSNFGNSRDSGRSTGGGRSGGGSRGGRR